MSVRIGVDVGGTFTDIVLLTDDGAVRVHKLPSTPDDQSEAFVAGVAAIADGADVDSIAHGTTVATNAVLERRGARTGLITTEGFRDVLVIGRQQRPRLYDLFVDRIEPVAERALTAGVRERIGRDGEVLVPLDEQDVRAVIDRLIAAGADSIAVCLLFSFANAAHERRIAEMIGDRARVSLSSEVVPEFREYERASTTALDAYVGPVVERYIERLSARIDVPIVVMRSGGGTMSAETAAREPVHTLLSGPAGGVAGAALVARAAGFDDIVTFDMGGTSTDVCLVTGGEPAVATEAEIGGLPFRTPSLAVHTVGAGGGCVLGVDDGGALGAGPRRAGAVPGPACYGRGGTEPAVTDAHLVLGHLDPAGFLGGRMRLDADAARVGMQRVASRVGSNIDDVARAGLDAARAAMAAAIRVVTVERGRDPRDFALVAFGGAGPMHATALAAQLGMRTVLIPPAAGVLSALGLLGAPLTSEASLTRPMIEPAPDEVAAVLFDVERRAVEGLRAQGAEPAGVSRSIDCRYRGQAHEVPVDGDDLDTLPARFADEHRARFGWDAPGEPVEHVTFRARASGPIPQVDLPMLEPGRGGGRDARVAWFGDARGEVGVFTRAALGAGDRLEGPCMVDGKESTTLIDPGWDAFVDEHGTIVAGKR